MEALGFYLFNHCIQLNSPGYYIICACLYLHDMKLDDRTMLLFIFLLRGYIIVSSANRLIVLSQSDNYLLNHGNLLYYVTHISRFLLTYPWQWTCVLHQVLLAEFSLPIRYHHRKYFRSWQHNGPNRLSVENGIMLPVKRHIKLLISDYFDISEL